MMIRETFDLRSETNLTFHHQSYWFAHLGRVVRPLIQDELFLHIWKEGSLFLSAVQKSSICGLVSWSLWHQHVPTNSTHTTLKILHRITNVLLWFHFPKELQWSNSYDECRTWYEGIWLRQVIHEEKPKQALQRFVWKNSLVQSRLWQCMKRYSMNERKFYVINLKYIYFAPYSFQGEVVRQMLKMSKMMI